MTEITPRRREILATLRTMTWLDGNPALNADREEMVLTLTLGEDLGLDSLEVVAVQVEIEDEFDIEIPDADMDGVRTVGDLGINGRRLRQVCRSRGQWRVRRDEGRERRMGT